MPCGRPGGRGRAGPAGQCGSGGGPRREGRLPRRALRGGCGLVRGVRRLRPAGLCPAPPRPPRLPSACPAGRARLRLKAMGAAGGDGWAGVPVGPEGRAALPRPGVLVAAQPEAGLSQPPHARCGGPAGGSPCCCSHMQMFHGFRSSARILRYTGWKKRACTPRMTCSYRPLLCPGLTRPSQKGVCKQTLEKPFPFDRCRVHSACLPSSSERMKWTILIQLPLGYTAPSDQQISEGKRAQGECLWEYSNLKSFSYYCHCTCSLCTAQEIMTSSQTSPEPAWAK
ncbi:uncharacterized protein LOC119149774 [Falco rusticolus]|uniref:uncharacterized protein LOC119149774 n=1 Tax=Falco rusticolus TaxID=120794 RepID=UPI001886647A|nr:uncharacterized protein LOC119149774 [Falco rusticolus]XP_055569520.1 uncharacterized protein LOC114017925 [Falco cherrug]